VRIRDLAVLSAAAALLVAAGCAQQPAARNVTPSAPAEGPVNAYSQIADDLVLSVEIPSTTLIAGSVSTATVTIANEGTATLSVSDSGPGIWIADSAGSVILSPKRIRHPIPLVPLEPKQTRSEDVTFSVPPPGTYALSVDWQVGVAVTDGGKTSPLQFTSVRP